MLYFYPAPGRGTGYCFRAISFFLSLFLCQQHYEKTAGLICMKFSGKVWSDHGTTWLNFGSIRVNGSAGQRSICLLSPAVAQRTGINKSVSFARWQQGVGLVVPRTTACAVLNSVKTCCIQILICLFLFTVYALSKFHKSTIFQIILLTDKQTNTLMMITCLNHTGPVLDFVNLRYCIIRSWRCYMCHMTLKSVRIGHDVFASLKIGLCVWHITSMKIKINGIVVLLLLCSS